MLSWRDRVELRNLLERGLSVTAIAKHTGKDPKTIRKYRDHPELLAEQPKARPRLVDDYARYIDARLADNEHLAGTVLLREIEALGFTGSYQSLARHLHRVRPDCPFTTGGEPAESVMMTHRLGSAQADWSPFLWTPAGQMDAVRVHLAALELCNAKFASGEFFLSEGKANFAAAHISAFDHLGGVPVEIRYDRSAEVFKRGSDHPTDFFADFAVYYGFKLVPCIPGRSRTKGVVERFFDYVQKSFFHSVDAATLAELNHRFRRWLDEVANQRTSSDSPVAPEVWLQAERPYLLGIRRPAYRVEQVVYRKVDKFCLVRLGGARYSVEPGNVGVEVAVITRPGSDLVEIRRAGEVIGSHQIAERGKVKFDPSHREAIEAITLARLGMVKGRARKRNDARIGPRSCEEAAILRARLTLGTDGEVRPVNLADYDQIWSDR